MNPIRPGSIAPHQQGFLTHQAHFAGNAAFQHSLQAAQSQQQSEQWAKMKAVAERQLNPQNQHGVQK